MELTEFVKNISLRTEKMTLVLLVSGKKYSISYKPIKAIHTPTMSPRWGLVLMCSNFLSYYRCYAASTKATASRYYGRK